MTLRFEGQEQSADDAAPVAYERRFPSLEDWRSRLQTTVESDALVIRGSCPVCERPLDDFVSLSPEWLEAVRAGKVAEPGDRTVETVTACNCDEEHEGRPEDAVGCGAVSVLTVELLEPREGGGETVAAQLLRARPATARDRSWDEEAARWEHERAERVGTLAERWAATISALFGIVGVALVLEGDRTVKAVASTASWPWWVLCGLLIALGALGFSGWLRRDEGERADALLGWGALVAAGAGIGLLAWGLRAGVPVKGGTTFGLLAGVAVASALAATGAAGFAAQGSPTWVNYLTGNRARRLRMESADRSARLLRRARIATIAAVTGLAAALAVYWYAPAPDAPPQRVVVSTADGERCGAFVSLDRAGLVFDPEGDAQQERIPPEALTAVRAAESCP